MSPFKSSQNEENNNCEDSIEKLPEPVYYVESSNDNTVLIGINITVNHIKTKEKEFFRISWYDTAHKRIMIASETSYKDNRFVFKRIDQEGGGYYYFMPMDLDIYNKRVKHQLIKGADFTNKKDLIKAFLNTTNDEI